MKIGILTFHRALNYGAVLQCYALQKTLQTQGYNVEVIDYKNDFITKFYSPFYIEKCTVKKIGYMFYAMNSKLKRNKIFSEFRDKYLNLSKMEYLKKNVVEANDKYDAIIVGSDQVWNMEQSKNDTTYLLDFVDPKKRYSYSASFGNDNIENTYASEFKENLKAFQEISVREKSGVEIVKNIVKKEAYNHLDPTLLLDRIQWNQLTVDSQIKEKYICVYKINVSACYELAQSLSKATNFKVVVIKPDKTCPASFEKIKFASPNEFLTLIKNAEYIITDSFHGVAFSTIFEKQFMTCLDTRINNKNVRIVDFINYLGLNERLNNSSKDISDILNSKINFKYAKEKIQKDKEISLEYLNRL